MSKPWRQCRVRWSELVNLGGSSGIVMLVVRCQRLRGHEDGPHVARRGDVLVTGTTVGRT